MQVNADPTVSPTASLSTLEMPCEIRTCVRHIGEWCPTSPSTFVITELKLLNRLPDPHPWAKFDCAVQTPDPAPADAEARDAHVRAPLGEVRPPSCNASRGNPKCCCRWHDSMCKHGSSRVPKRVVGRCSIQHEPVPHIHTTRELAKQPKC